MGAYCTRESERGRRGDPLGESSCIWEGNVKLDIKAT
jgi:hypothetical protein